MLRSEATICMQVIFGRPNGEQTLGVIVKLNPKTAKVKILESRGTRTTAGAVWKVPYELMRPAPNQAAPEVNLEDRPLDKSLGVIDRRIVELIDVVYSHLSPESLTCDGELSRTQVQIRSRELNRQLQGLFKALGRPVSESVALEWVKANSKQYN